VSNGTLIAGGAFTSIGGVAAGHLARWDGTTWSELAGGIADGQLPGRVYGLCLFNDEIQVGGSFTVVPHGTLESPLWARYSETGAPWFAQQPHAQIVSCNANTGFQIRPAEGYGGLAYQWRKNGLAIPVGPTGTGSTIFTNGINLDIHNVSSFDQGVYDCV